MAQDEELRDRTVRVPEHMIETINKVVRTSRQILPEIGREPAAEELAKRLGMPLERLEKVLNIARQPIRLEPAIWE
jgi:RNA polymerase primary sigma factor